MKTLFYKSTAYHCGIGVLVPECFITLDDYFDTKFTSAAFFDNMSVRLAQNLCCRMANVDLYASIIQSAENGQSATSSAILISTYLVAYYSACKSVLDAVAIILSILYNLNLTPKEMDFTKPKFWRQLNDGKPEIYDWHHSRHSFYKDVRDWRDSAIHRVLPLVVVHGPDKPDKTPRDRQTIKMYAKLDF